MNALTLMPLPMNETWKVIEDIVGDCCEIRLATDPGGYMCHVTADAGRVIAHAQCCTSPGHALVECMVQCITWQLTQTTEPKEDNR